MIKYITVLILFATFIGNTHAPDEQKFKVCVYVPTDEEAKTEQIIIESHLKRELRALGHVDIVDNTNTWDVCISVRVMNMSYMDGRKSPFVIIGYCLNMQVPISLFKTYDYKWPFIPVLSPEPPGLAMWPRDNLHAWCIA